MSSARTPRGGYRIDHPEGWYTSSDDVTARCQVFDAAPIELTPDTHLPLDVAVTLVTIDRPVAQIPTIVEDDPATDVQTVEETEVDARHVVVVEGVAPGEAYLPAGTAVHRAHVPLGERTLAAHANDLGEPDLDIRRAVIADMLATLEG